MATDGWVKIHRQIQNTWLWKEKPFSRAQAWIDLILLANHEDRKIVIGNKLMEVKRGSLITSELKLAERWGWSRKKVRNFIEVLESDKMLSKNSTSKYTSLTLENYGLYQDIGPTKEQQKNSTGTTREHQKNINKNNNKNYKNDKKENIYNPPYNPPLKKGEIPAVENYTANPELKKAIYDFIEMRKQIKKPMTFLAIELLLRNLNRLSSTDREKILILEQSILNSWQGIFPLKEKPAEVENAKKQKSASRPEDDPIIRMGLEMKRKREMMQKNDSDGTNPV